MTSFSPARITTTGVVGESYNVGSRSERTNLQVVEAVCDLVDQRASPLPSGEKRRPLIRFVSDRPGHDRRYAINPTKIERLLGWTPKRCFEEGLPSIVDWFLANECWWRPLRERYVGERLGQGR